MGSNHQGRIARLDSLHLRASPFGNVHYAGHFSAVTSPIRMSIPDRLTRSYSLTDDSIAIASLIGVENAMDRSHPIFSLRAAAGQQSIPVLGQHLQQIVDAQDVAICADDDTGARSRSG